LSLLPLTLTIEPFAKMVKKQIIKSFVGSRGGFSKEPLAAGGIFASSSIDNYFFVDFNLIVNC
jgi:hypothetical protein